MKILITGKLGQVGFELQRSLAVLGELIAVDRTECDLSDPDSIRALVRRVCPDIIVNPAAYTAVDKAESEVSLANAVNATAPGIFAEEADRRAALFVHYSTDYVFDGVSSDPYLESDQTNPQSIYGRTKCAGEVAVRHATDRHLILRTSWVLGTHGGNFAKTMLRLAAERDSLSVVADQWGAPTSAALLADITAHLVREWQRNGDNSFPYGTYHAVAGGETNWFDYAKFVIGEAIFAGRSMRVAPDSIRPIASSDYPTPARRPANSRLNTTLLSTTFGLKLPHWQHGVRHILQQIL